MEELCIKVVARPQYESWRKHHGRTLFLSQQDEKSLVPQGAHVLDLEEITNESMIPVLIPVRFSSDTKLRDALNEITRILKKVMPPRKKLFTERAVDIIGFIFAGWLLLPFWYQAGKFWIPGLLNDDYDFKFPCVHRIDITAHARKSLGALGVRPDDIFLVDYSYPVPGAMAFWGDLAKDRRFWSGKFDNFMDNVVADYRYTYNPDRMVAWKKPRPPSLGAIVLYTEEDWQIARYVRQYYAALHIMSQFYLTIYVFEQMPRGHNDQQTRSFWATRLPKLWYPTWSALGLTMSKPYPNAAVYELCNRIGITADRLPCVVLFSQWKEIRSERIILPICGSIARLFRRMCSDVRRIVDGARGDRSPMDYFESFSLDSFRQKLPPWWQRESELAAEECRGRKRSLETEMPTVFLCHSSADKEFVDRLARDLRGLGLGVWFDKWDIEVGDSIISRIESALQSTRYLAVVLSPSSVSSVWVRRELNAALIRELEEDKVVILPLLYQSCEIPLLIRDKLYADFTGKYEDGFRAFVERLAPGMLDEGSAD